MAELSALHKCDVALDTSGMGTEHFAAAAFREVEAFCEQLDERFRREGVTLKGVMLRPVLTDKLRRYLEQEAGLFRMEVDYRPVVIGGEERPPRGPS